MLRKNNKHVKFESKSGCNHSYTYVHMNRCEFSTFIEHLTLKFNCEKFIDLIQSTLPKLGYTYFKISNLFYFYALKNEGKFK